MALPANIRLGFEGLLETNTLAYQKYLFIKTLTSFITLGPSLMCAGIWIVQQSKALYANPPAQNTLAYFD